MEKKAHVTMLRLERHGVSRRALIAFILITQILVLASTNFAAYTWGITRLVEILASAPRMSNSNSFSGPQVRTQPKFLEFNETYTPRDLLLPQMQRGKPYFHLTVASSKTARSHQLAQVSLYTINYIAWTPSDTRTMFCSTQYKAATRSPCLSLKTTAQTGTHGIA
ncbi:hypothetical protein HBI13_168990 [Parastagonospora nodorum]|nr:hypothetical protein HBI10_112660 [Parastagonospora nodorum]KAH4014661.1 hypothetical protein HBI13_168990 [Parastagonospora nodorum]